MASPAIPNLPPLSSIKDDATRSYLQALTNAWLVRNGQVGDGDERFLTAGDFSSSLDPKPSRVRGGGYVGGPLTPGSDNGSKDPNARLVDALEALRQKIEQDVINSVTFRKLGERLDFMERPEWFEGQGAGLKAEQIRISNFTSALAAQTTTAITQINSNLAIANERIASVSTQTGAMAESVTSLQASVYGSGTADDPGLVVKAQQALTVAADIEQNLAANWSVKVDMSGTKPYVAGVALGVSKGADDERPWSDFIVRADRFAVGSPETGADNVAPFIVTTYSERLADGTVVPPGIWVNGAVIKTASITDAHIKDGTISSAKIADTIQSLGFDGVNGWQIRKDGSAYFGGNVTIAGKITGGSLQQVLKTEVRSGSVRLGATVGTGLERLAVVSYSLAGLGMHYTIDGEPMTITVTLHNDVGGFSFSAVATAPGGFTIPINEGEVAYSYL